MSEPLPSYEDLCRRAKLVLPASYYDFLKLCIEVSSDDPWNVFEDLGLRYLAFGTPADPGFSLEWSIPPSADAPPELVVFAESWGAGVFHGFFVEDTAAPAGEHSIVTVDSPTAVRLAALTFSDFLEGCAFPADEFTDAEGKEAQALLCRRLGIRRGPWARFARSWDDSGKARGDAFVKLLKDAFDSAPEGEEEVLVELPFSLDVPNQTLVDAWARRLSAIRVRQGCAPTADGIGLRLPEGTVDRDFVADLEWPSRETRPKPPPDYSLLIQARRRLAQGEPGTALVIAKSLRYVHWYDDWKTERRCLRETGEIMEACYRALGRQHAAHNVRVQTDYNLERVR